MTTFVFIYGKLYIVVNSDTKDNAEIVAKDAASKRLGEEFDGMFNTVVELPAYGTAVIKAA